MKKDLDLAKVMIILEKFSSEIRDFKKEESRFFFNIEELTFF